MFDAEAIRSRIEDSARSEAELSAAEARDVAFHMTDWLGDLAAFVRFCEEPSRLSSAQINELLTDFLVHVPNHVAAASKLLVDMPVSDVFGVGAVEPAGRGAG
jgi:hypothetical protein